MDVFSAQVLGLRLGLLPGQFTHPENGVELPNGETHWSETHFFGGLELLSLGSVLTHSPMARQLGD